MALDRVGDRLAWARLPVVPRFRRPPVGFVPALAATWMTPIWMRPGCAGYNFWTTAAPEAPGGRSGRYNPDHPLFQAWVCVYLRRRVPLGRSLFGFTRDLEPVADEFVPLGRADQRAWLWVKGADWAPVHVHGDGEEEPARVGGVETVLSRSTMYTHADVGFDNPDPSPLGVHLRPPRILAGRLDKASFAPREEQWRGKIRPYQEIEYTVHGYPIALPEHGLSAFFFYAGARYERGGRSVDTFEAVREAVAPVLEGGIEFVENKRRLPLFP